MTRKTLLVESSARHETSRTRSAAAALAAQLGGEVTTRDLDSALPQIKENWVFANFTGKDDRSDAQKDDLALSDSLVQELQDADDIVIGVPIYNFNIPAALKLWIDQVARVGETFSYTENGPVGLLEGKKVHVVMASGGVPLGSDMDYATPYLKFVLAFMGLTDVTFVHDLETFENAA